MRIKEIKRMVVKIGSSLIVDNDKGVDVKFLDNIGEDILSLRKKGVETLIVSSGAIELGKTELKKTTDINIHPNNLKEEKFNNKSCLFEYRNSVFKKKLKNF